MRSWVIVFWHAKCTAVPPTRCVYFAKAPNLNIIKDPRWGRLQEAPSEDPWMTATYGYNFVTGSFRKPLFWNHTVDRYILYMFQSLITYGRRTLFKIYSSWLFLSVLHALWAKRISDKFCWSFSVNLFVFIIGSCCISVLFLNCMWNEWGDACDAVTWVIHVSTICNLRRCTRR